MNKSRFILCISLIVMNVYAGNNCDPLVANSDFHIEKQISNSNKSIVLNNCFKLISTLLILAGGGSLFYYLNQKSAPAPILPLPIPIAPTLLPVVEIATDNDTVIIKFNASLKVGRVIERKGLGTYLIKTVLPSLDKDINEELLHIYETGYLENKNRIIFVIEDIEDGELGSKLNLPSLLKALVKK